MKLRHLQTIFIWLTSVICCAAPPSLRDDSFNPGSGFDAPPRVVLIQPDGKILAAGEFNTYNDIPRKRIARLNSDGSLDSTFDPGSSTDAKLEALALTPDGKIYVGGQFTNFAGLNIQGIVRLFPDGRVDPAFAPPLILRPELRIRLEKKTYSTIGPVPIRFALDADQKIYFDARPFLVKGKEKPSIMRLLEDGSVDSAFQSSFHLQDWMLHQIIPAQDGKVWLAGRFDYNRATGRSFGFLPLLPMGDIDPSFALSYSVSEAIALFLQESKIVVVTPESVVRFSTNGSMDPSFKSVTADGLDGILSAAATLDDHLVVAGSFSKIDSLDRFGLARLLPQGGVDLTFDPFAGFESPSGAGSLIYSTATGPSAKTVAVGYFNRFDKNFAPGIVQLIQENQFGQSLFKLGSLNYTIRESAAEQITIDVIRLGPAETPSSVGYHTTAGSATNDSDFVPRTGVIQFGPGERLKTVAVAIVDDETEEWGESFIFSLTQVTSGTQVDDSSNTATIWIPGNDFTYTLEWIQSQSTTRESYPRARGMLYIKSQAKPSAWRESPFPADDLFQVEIEELEARLGRDYLPLFKPTLQNQWIGDGLDYTGMNAQVWVPVLDNQLWDGPRRFVLKLRSLSPRVTINGTNSLPVTILDNDNAAGPGRVVRGLITAIAPSSGGNWLVAGPFDFYDGIPRSGLARVFSNKILDTSFDAGSGVDGSITALAEDPSGKVWIAGDFSSVDGQTRTSVARLLPTGIPDQTFLPPTWNGPESRANYSQLFRLPDGVLLGGNAWFERTAERAGVVRLSSTGTPQENWNIAQLPIRTVTALLPLADGSALVSGEHQLSGKGALLRLLPDGTLQEDFHLILDGPATGLITLSDQTIWIATTANLLRLARLPNSAYLVDASSVSTIIHPEHIYGLGQGLNGAIYLNGWNNGRRGLFSYNADGSPNLSALFYPGEFGPIAFDFSRSFLALPEARLDLSGRTGFTIFTLRDVPRDNLSLDQLVRLPNGEIHLGFSGQIWDSKLQTSQNLTNWIFVPGEWMTQQRMSILTYPATEKFRFFLLRK